MNHCNPIDMEELYDRQANHNKSIVEIQEVPTHKLVEVQISFLRKTTNVKQGLNQPQSTITQHGKTPLTMKPKEKHRKGQKQEKMKESKENKQKSTKEKTFTTFDFKRNKQVQLQ